MISGSWFVPTHTRRTETQPTRGAPQSIDAEITHDLSVNRIHLHGFLHQLAGWWRESVIRTVEFGETSAGGPGALVGERGRLRLDARLLRPDLFSPLKRVGKLLVAPLSFLQGSCR